MLPHRCWQRCRLYTIYIPHTWPRCITYHLDTDECPWEGVLQRLYSETWEILFLFYLLFFFMCLAVVDLTRKNKTPWHEHHTFISVWCSPRRGHAAKPATLNVVSTREVFFYSITNYPLSCYIKSISMEKVFCRKEVCMNRWMLWKFLKEIH